MPVETVEHAHIAERVEPDAAGEDQPVDASRADDVLDHVEQRILEHELRRGCLVDALLRRRAVSDIVDAEHGVGIPHVLECDRRAENACERGRIGIVEQAAVPVGEGSVELYRAVLAEDEDVLQLRVIRIGSAVAVAVGGRAHVAAFARQPGPAALGRTDDRVEDAEAIEQAVVAEHALHAGAAVGVAVAAVERDRAHIAEAVEHANHHRSRRLRERRGGIREPRMVVVVRHADDRHRRGEVQHLRDAPRGTGTLIEMAHVERRCLGGRDHAETRRRFLAAGLDQRRAEHRIVP